MITPGTAGQRQPMLRKQTILDALQDGPVTASELGAILELPMRICSAWLGNLRCAGVVEVIGTRTMGKRQSNIYNLAQGSRLRTAAGKS